MQSIIKNHILNRRSTYPKDFIEGKKIPDQVIKELLATAVWAPTHKLTEPWFFRVFKGDGIDYFFAKQKEIYQKITPADKITKGKLDKYDAKSAQVSHVVAVCVQRDERQRIPEIEEIIAAGCVIENIYLLLQDFGIAGYLSTGDICYTTEMHTFLGLNDGQRCLGFFQLGYEKPDRPEIKRKRTTASEKTIWIGE